MDPLLVRLHLFTVVPSLLSNAIAYSVLDGKDARRLTATAKATWMPSAHADDWMN